MAHAVWERCYHGRRHTICRAFPLLFKPQNAMPHCAQVQTAARLGAQSLGHFAVWLAALWIAGALCSPAIAQDGAQEHPRALLDKIREQK